jgi:hypothetical protein
VPGDISQSKERQLKPVRIISERIKSNSIVIWFFRNRNYFSYDLTTNIGGEGFCIPRKGRFKSYQEARQAAYDFIIQGHTSPKQKEILQQFRFIKDYAQLGLFDAM